MSQTNILNISKLIIPATNRNGRQLTTVGGTSIGGSNGGGGGTVDLSAYLKLTSPTEQTIDSLLTLKQNIKVNGVIVNKVTEDLNTAVSAGSDGVEFYRFRSTAANTPSYIGIDDGFVQTFNWNQSNYAFQIAYDVDATGIAFRSRNELNIWSNWIKVANKEEPISEYKRIDIDNVSSTITTTYNYKSLKVYVNGVRLFYYDDYIEMDDKNIQLIEIPQIGDKVILDYIKK